MPLIRRTVRLHTFGGLDLTDGTQVVASQRHRLALLALLAVAGDRGCTRDKLMAYLWPESPIEAARHGLQQLLYYLRRQAHADLFLGTDPLRLNPEAISADVAEFEATLAAGALSEAVALYRGPFLDGFYLGNAPTFESWAERERARLATAHAAALYRLAHQAGAAEHHTQEIAFWRELTAADPLSERVATGLIRALAGSRSDRAAGAALCRDPARGAGAVCRWGSGAGTAIEIQSRAGPESRSHSVSSTGP